MIWTCSLRKTLKHSIHNASAESVSVNDLSRNTPVQHCIFIFCVLYHFLVKHVLKVNINMKFCYYNLSSIDRGTTSVFLLYQPSTQCSSVQNILLRRALDRKLNVALPQNEANTLCYPKLFSGSVRNMSSQKLWPTPKQSTVQQHTADCTFMLIRLCYKMLSAPSPIWYPVLQRPTYGLTWKSATRRHHRFASCRHLHTPSVPCQTLDNIGQYCTVCRP